MSEERAPSGERGRWSSRRKTEVVLRAKIGELTMEVELLRERARRAEGDGGPFGRRRSR
jgi:hypothetical protein